MTILTGRLLQEQRSDDSATTLERSCPERPRSGPVASLMVCFDPLAGLVGRVPGMRYHQPAAAREHVAEPRVTATCEIGVLERDDITLPAAAGTGAALAGVVDLDVHEATSLRVVGEVLDDVERPRIRRGVPLVVPDHDPAVAKRLLAVVRRARPMRRLRGQKIAGAGPVTEEATQLIQLRRHFVPGASLPEIQQGGCARDGGAEGEGGRFHERSLR